MSDPILPLLLAMVCVLLVLGAVGAAVPRASRQAVGFVGAVLGGWGALLALLVLTLDQSPASLALPVGPPGMTLHLALDALSGFFLLLLFLSGTACVAVAAEATESPDAAPATLAGSALCLAGSVLTILAADAVTMAIGLSLSGRAIWATGTPGRARAWQLGVSQMAALTVLAAAVLCGGATFAAIRPHPTPFLFLACFGPIALAGLVPFHGWVIPAHQAAPARAGALLSGAMQPLSIYVLLRVLLDLAGPAPPVWWCWPFLGLGAVSAVLGGWRAAAQAVQVDSILAAMTIRQTGLAAIGIGFALLGRASDLPTLTSMGLAAVLLLSLGQALCGTLAHLAAGAVRQGAGSRLLAMLGGLVHPMPIVTLGMGAALLGWSGLPAGIGFAGIWLLFQAVLDAPRMAGLGMAIGLGVVATALAVSSMLAGTALVRLIGVAFLGRPRGPRAAGAVDMAAPARPGFLVLAALSGLAGLMPGAALLVLAEPAIRFLTHDGLGVRSSGLGLFPSTGWSGYLSVPLIAVAGVVAGCLLALQRRRPGPPPRVSPIWNDGFAPPPAWLPFGEPLTQVATAGFLPPLTRPPLSKLRMHLPRLDRLWALVGASAAVLAVLAWIGLA